MARAFFVLVVTCGHVCVPAVQICDYVRADAETYAEASRQHLLAHPELVDLRASLEELRALDASAAVAAESPEDAARRQCASMVLCSLQMCLLILWHVVQ